MAFDINSFVKDKTKQLENPGGFNVDSFLKSKGITPKRDLGTSEGLYQTALDTGGPVADAADDIMQPDQSFFGRVKTGLKTALSKTLDVLQRPNFAIASAVKNTIDDDPETTFGGGLKSGITGQTKHTFHDVFTEADWNPESRLGKIAKGASGFALDVLLDPTTYVTFGTGAGIKVAAKGGAKVLSKEGGQFLAKGLQKGLGKEFGEEFVKQSILNMAEKSPELYSKFIDQGGLKFFNKTIISGGRVAGVVEAIPGMSKLDEATAPVRNTIYALFNRDASAKFGKLPKEFTDLKQKYLDLGRVKGADAVEGAIKIAQANKLTQQEAEIITNAIEAGTHLADERLENSRKLFERMFDRNLKEELKRGIGVGELPNYVPHILVENPTKNLPFKPEGVRVSLGASKGRTIEGTVQEINERFGKDFFDPNIINLAANRSLASSRAQTSADFLREVGQKFGALADRSPGNYVEVGAKELKGLKFHPAIAEQIDKFKKGLINDEATNSLLKGFDYIQNLWKASVTSVFPAFHGRNAISNVFLNYLDIGSSSLSPAKHKLSAQILELNRQAEKLDKLVLGVGEGAVKAKGKLNEVLEKVVLTDNAGKKWSFGELRKVIKENRVALGSDYTGFMDIPETVKRKLGKATTITSKAKRVGQAVNPLSQDNIAFKAGRKVGSVIEEQARILNFITNLERTGDVLTSAQRTKQFLFDYQNLSDFEKNVMRRLVPFYTFTRKNLELQATQLFKQPGKFATQAKLFNTASDLLSGASLSEDEKNLLPEFLKEGLGIVYSRDGKDVQVIGETGTPIEAAFKTLKPNALLGSLNPIISVPLQAAIGKHFFFNKDLKDVNDAKAYQNAPQFIKDYIGYTTRTKKDGSIKHIALNPTRLFILNNIPPSSRVVSTIGQLEEENVSGKLKTLRQLTGLKPYGVDLEEQELYAEKDKIRELQDLLDKSGVAPIFQKSFIPKKK